MTSQSIIHPRTSAAPTLDAVLGSITTAQSLNCRFDERLGMWFCDVWGPASNWTADLYGTGESLAAAIADLHPPERMKRAREASGREWTTEEAPE